MKKPTIDERILRDLAEDILRLRAMGETDRANELTRRRDVFARSAYRRAVSAP